MTEEQPKPVTRGKIGAVGGVLGPLALIGIAFVTLRAMAGGDTPVMVLVPAALFFGLMAFDLAVAVGFAVSRHRGQAAGNYSTAAAFGIILLPIWLMVAAAQNQGSWVASPLPVVVVGLACLVAQVIGVARLNRVGRHAQPT